MTNRSANNKSRRRHSAWGSRGSTTEAKSRSRVAFTRNAGWRNIEYSSRSPHFSSTNREGLDGIFRPESWFSRYLSGYIALDDPGKAFDTKALFRDREVSCHSKRKNKRKTLFQILIEQNRRTINYNKLTVGIRNVANKKAEKAFKLLTKISL